MNCNFFFVRPGRNKDAYNTANRLAEIRKVKEVFLTEGDVGFVVKTDTVHKEDSYQLLKQISKVAGGSSSKAVCYCLFNK